MKYDFTTVLNRHGKDALAVDGVGCTRYAPARPKKDRTVIPMWVADMNFATCPAIQEAITERVKHPCFGYFFPTDAYYNAIRDWQASRNGVETLPTEAIGYENGVLGCLASAVEAFTSPGDAILIHSPVYVGFTGTIENLGRKIIHSPLVQDRDGIWRMDYADMAQKIRDHRIHFAVFCSPHNPCGRVWQREEIEAAMEVYRKEEVLVVSDEIWSDILLDGQKHIPTQSISEDAKNRTIAVYAPSKTFNLAGMVGSYHIVYNQYLRERLEQRASLSHYNAMNVLSMHALIGAYSAEGKEWVDELCATLSENISYAVKRINETFDGIRTTMPEGTYMLFLNCREWCETNKKSMDDLIRAGWDEGVAWQDGRPFYDDYAIRMNLALPITLIKEALDRIEKAVL